MELWLANSAPDLVASRSLAWKLKNILLPPRYLSRSLSRTIVPPPSLYIMRLLAAVFTLTDWASPWTRAAADYHNNKSPRQKQPCSDQGGQVSFALTQRPFFFRSYPFAQREEMFERPNIRSLIFARDNPDLNDDCGLRQTRKKPDWEFELRLIGDCCSIGQGITTVLYSGKLSTQRKIESGKPTHKFEDDTCLLLGTSKQDHIFRNTKS